MIVEAKITYNNGGFSPATYTFSFSLDNSFIRMEINDVAKKLSNRFVSIPRKAITVNVFRFLAELVKRTIEDGKTDMYINIRDVTNIDIVNYLDVYSEIDREINYTYIPGVSISTEWE